jgi:hypothetical protein
MTASDKLSAAWFKTKADTYRKTTSREGPTAIPPEKMDEDDIVKFEKALLAYWQMSEYDLIVPFGIMSFQHSSHSTKARWWRSVNKGGWAVVDNGKEAVSNSVEELRHRKVKNPSNSDTRSHKSEFGTARIFKTHWII